MELEEATILALQGKLFEGLDAEITKWSPDAKKQDVINQIAQTNKPIKYVKIGGFDRAGIAVYEEQEISIEQVEKLFAQFEGYFVTEYDDYVKISRVE